MISLGNVHILNLRHFEGITDVINLGNVNILYLYLYDPDKSDSDDDIYDDEVVEEEF